MKNPLQSYVFFIFIQFVITVALNKMRYAKCLIKLGRFLGGFENYYYLCGEKVK